MNATPISNPHAHEGADRLADEVLQRLEGTDWEFAQAYTRQHNRFHCILSRKGTAIPTPVDRALGQWPEGYYEIYAADFESYRIGVNEKLRELGL